VSGCATQQQAICIRGLGLVTPLGQNLETSWQRIVEGASIVDHARAPVEGVSGIDRVSALGVRAAREACERAGWAVDRLRDPRTALVVGTSKGAVDEWIEWSRRLRQDVDRSNAQPQGSQLQDVAAPPSPSDNPLTWFSAAGDQPIGLHTVATILAREIGLGCGPAATVSCACATGPVALIRGAMLIRDDSADRVLVVASESSLHPLFIGSFTRLGVLARSGQGVRPLDCNRGGFLISEAAAAVCLERGHAQAGDVQIEQFALGADATHLTGVDPQGRTLRACLDRLIASQPVDLIHAHATGTALNDPIELAAIDDAASRIASARPHVYSHKAAIGHSLGAAGLVAVVLNCLMHQHGTIPGNINTTEPLAAKHIEIERAARSRGIDRSVAIAAGFGGTVAGVTLISG